MNKKAIFKWYAKNFAKNKYRKFNVFLFNLGLRGLGVMNFHSFKLSGEEYFINDFLTKMDINTVFDVGANEGDYAAHFLQRKDCTVHCFEPNKSTYDRLSTTFGDKPSIKLHHFGLSNEKINTVMYDSEGSNGAQTATIYKDVIEDLFQKEPIEISIELRTLDEVVAELGIDNIDLLKIDTEGNEFKVLQGARSSLKKGMIKVIHFEFNMMNVVSRVYLKDFIDLLTDFNLYRLLPNEMMPIIYKRPLANELFAFQNIIAIRKDIDKNQ